MNAGNELLGCIHHHRPELRTLRGNGDEEGIALTTATAEGANSNPATAAAEFVDKVNDEARTRHSHRMP